MEDTLNGSATGTTIDVDALDSEALKDLARNLQRENANLKAALESTSGFNAQTGAVAICDSVVIENIRGERDLTKGMASVIKKGADETWEQYVARQTNNGAVCLKIVMALKRGDDGRSSKYGITIAGVHHSARGTVDGNEASIDGRSANKKV